MITKGGRRDHALAPAVEKVRFEAVAVMRFRRAGPRRQTSVELLGPDRGMFSPRRSTRPSFNLAISATPRVELDRIAA
jgi:hypothetical protein